MHTSIAEAPSALPRADRDQLDVKGELGVLWDLLGSVGPISHVRRNRDDALPALPHALDPDLEPPDHLRRIAAKLERKGRVVPHLIRDDLYPGRKLRLLQGDLLDDPPALLGLPWA